MFKGISEAGFAKLAQQVAKFQSQELQDLANSLVPIAPSHDSAIGQFIYVLSQGQEPDAYLIGKVSDELQVLTQEEAEESFSDDEDMPTSALDQAVFSFEDFKDSLRGQL